MQPLNDPTGSYPMFPQSNLKNICIPYLNRFMTAVLFWKQPLKSHIVCPQSEAAVMKGLETYHVPGIPLVVCSTDWVAATQRCTLGDMSTLRVPCSTKIIWCSLLLLIVFTNFVNSTDRLIIVMEPCQGAAV